MYSLGQEPDNSEIIPRDIAGMKLPKRVQDMFDKFERAREFNPKVVLRLGIAEKQILSEFGAWKFGKTYADISLLRYRGFQIV
jgi:hypothetical protein